MSEPGRPNAELLKKLEETNPLLGLSCSYSPYPVRLWIQDMKNYYVNYYRFASKHVHFIHFNARSRLPNELVAKVETELLAQVIKANEEIDEAIVQAEALMKAHGVTLSVTEMPNRSPPLCHTAEVISPLTNRYIQLIEKTDYLLRGLDPLFQKEVITMEEYNLRRGLFKRHVKHFYYACRNFSEALRLKMNSAKAVAANGQSKNDGNGIGAAATARAVSDVEQPSDGRPQEAARSQQPSLHATAHVRPAQVGAVVT